MGEMTLSKCLWILRGLTVDKAVPNPNCRFVWINSLDFYINCYPVQSAFCILQNQAHTFFLSPCSET